MNRFSVTLSDEIMRYVLDNATQSRRQTCSYLEGRNRYVPVTPVFTCPNSYSSPYSSSFPSSPTPSFPSSSLSPNLERRMNFTLNRLAELFIKNISLHQFVTEAAKLADLPEEEVPDEPLNINRLLEIFLMAYTGALNSDQKNDTSSSSCKSSSSSSSPSSSTSSTEQNTPTPFTDCCSNTSPSTPSDQEGVPNPDSISNINPAPQMTCVNEPSTGFDMLQVILPGLNDPQMAGKLLNLARQIANYGMHNTSSTSTNPTPTSSTTNSTDDNLLDEVLDTPLE